MTTQTASKTKVVNHCELCGNVADRKCNTCQVTFYCCAEHQSLDFAGIHEKCCSVIQEIRQKTVCVTDQERKIRKQRKEELTQLLLSKCLKQSEIALMKQEHELAIPSSLLSLKCAKIIFGKNNIRLVPILLTLSRACLGTSRIKQCEQFLSMCKIIMHQNSCNDYLLRSQFHRLYGRLHAMSNRLERALHELSFDVYYSSLAAGPMHIRTAAGYYQISQVLLRQRKIEAALQCYAQIVQIWTDYLNDMQSKDTDIVAELGNNQIHEASMMLQTILDARKNYLGSTHLETGKAYHAFALLCELSNDLINAQAFYKETLSVYQTKLGQEHEQTTTVQKHLQQIDEQVHK